MTTNNVQMWHILCWANLGAEVESLSLEKAIFIDKKKYLSTACSVLLVILCCTKEALKWTSLYRKLSQFIQFDLNLFLKYLNKLGILIVIIIFIPPVSSWTDIIKYLCGAATDHVSMVRCMLNMTQILQCTWRSVFDIISINPAGLPYTLLTSPLLIMKNVSPVAPSRIIYSPSWKKSWKLIKIPFDNH